VKVPDNQVKDSIEALRKWARENNIRQAELARMLSVSAPRLNQWFTGKVEPNLQAWLRIQQLLKTRPPKPKAKPGKAKPPRLPKATQPPAD
jgi:transcriptional regulator with XRE-family HTH domain